MKVALIFNGLLRSIQYTINNLDEYIFKQLKKEKINYDVYCHNFNLQKYNNSRNKEKNIILKPENFKLLNANYYLEDDQLKIAENIDFNKYLINGDKWGNNHNTAKNYILSLWSKNKITQHLINNVKNGKHYDYIIFIRSDVIFHKKINFRQLLSKIKNDNDCIIPDYHHFKGFNDRMFISKYNLAIYYGQYYNYILELINNGHKLHSETFNLLLLNNYKANIIKEPIYFSRMRSNGKLKKENFKI
jgi:hypothetical protein